MCGPRHRIVGETDGSGRLIDGLSNAIIYGCSKLDIIPEPFDKKEECMAATDK
jgi:hypothetical protein